ncbi:MAG: hypothetical protein K6B70_04275 [Clostridia bacterium]|nr:hypothetical protein [Clostridia bacterium]
MENKKCRLVTEEEKEILKGVKRIGKELKSELETYYHLMIDIDDGLDTLYEHEVMTDTEIMEFINRNDCLYAYNEAKKLICEYGLPFEMYAIVPIEFLLQARTLILKRLDYYGLEIE